MLCEKPLALNLADCDAMVSAAERAGVKLAVYHNYLWYPSTRKLRELIAEGAIGDVISTEIRGLGLRGRGSATTHTVRVGDSRSTRAVGER